MTMTTYTADDFRKADFARGPRGHIAARVCTGPGANLYAWRCSDIPGRSDRAMADDGWAPVPAGSDTRTDEPVDPEGDAAWWRARAEETEVQRDDWKVRAEKAERAAQTLGKVVEDQCRDIARITRSEHMVDADGDADWGAIWERGHEMAEHLEQATGRVDVLREEVARTVRERDEWEANAEKAEQERDVLAERVRGFADSIREQQKMIDRLRAEQPRPLTPDAITDEMRGRARKAAAAQMPDSWWGGTEWWRYADEILTATLTEPTPEPTDAERLVDVLVRFPGRLAGIRDIADHLASEGVRAPGAES